MKYFALLRKLQQTSWLVILLLPVPLNALECQQAATQPNNFLPFSLVNHYPHDNRAFTQGLFYHNGYLYESTGLYGKSTLTKRLLASEQALATTNLNKDFFGEGIAANNDNEVFQLTWRAKTVFSYALDTLEQKKQFKLDGEGWGLTFDGQHFIVSDGSAQLHWHDQKTFKRLYSKPISYLGRPLKHINELEWINGCIAANIWQTPFIAIINLQTGFTSHLINIKKMLKREKALAKSNKRRLDVANGIAWHANNQSLLITGKFWSTIYEIKLNQPSN